MPYFQRFNLTVEQCLKQSVCPDCGNELHFSGRCGTCYCCYYSTCEAR